jgi:hypothetical protein
MGNLPWEGNNPEKSGLMPHILRHLNSGGEKLASIYKLALKNGLISYQLVGEVMAYQD